jgi:hypothetical protein
MIAFCSYNANLTLESCVNWNVRPNVEQRIDFAINMYFMAVFALKVGDYFSINQSISDTNVMNIGRAKLTFDLCFVCYVTQLIAANDKLLFWLDINSLVDYLTIPPYFVTLVIGQQWLGSYKSA